MPGAPVVLVGLDAADPALVERWAGEGRLPTFARLLREGRFGRLRSTAAVFSGTPWLSIATGCNPARCGVYTRHQLVSGTYDVRRVKADDLRVPPFWASFRGPVAVVDVPKAPPLPTLDGVQLVEWGAYDHYASFTSVPPDLAAEVVAGFGRHPFLDRRFEEALPGRRDFAAIRALLVEAVRAKQRLNGGMLERFGPRFFFSVFGETHAAGHAFWRFQDPRHPLFDDTSPFVGALADVYGAVDSALADLSSALPAGATLLVVSGHGFTMDNLAGDLLQQVLVRTGMAVPRQRAVTAHAAYVPGLAFDMSRTRAFCLPTDWHGFVRLNLRGREPDGIVAEEDYGDVCAEIERELLALRHRGTGSPVVSGVVRVRDAFDGPFVDALPDISVAWNPDVIAADVESPGCGTIRRDPDRSGGCGNHREEGFLLAHGPGVTQGRFEGHVLDVAPTVARLLAEACRPEWEGAALDLSAAVTAAS
jgi:predicted AlkP superfamily phosphohydrolase/phosphomutase